MKTDKPNRYSDFLRKKFLRYTLGVIFVMYVVFIVFIAMNILFATVWGTRNKNRKISAELGKVCTNFSVGLDALAGEPDIQAALAGNETALQSATEKLYAFANSRRIASSFILLDTEGGIIATSLFQSNRFWFQASPLAKRVLEKLDDEPNLTYSTISQLDYSYDQKGDYLFARAIQDDRGITIGYLLFDLKDNAIYDHVITHNLDQVTITDRFDNIVFSTHRMQADPMEKYPVGRYRLEWTGKWTARQGRIEYFVDRQPFLGGELQVYALTSIAYQQQMFAYGSIFLLIVGILIICIVFNIIKYTTHRNLKAIDELTAVAERIGQGELSYQVTTHSFDEFEVLATAMNLLTKNLQEMIRHNEELAEHKRVLELKQLESQFNPHFVFNTMEAIRYKIVLEPESASEMVFTFANLMRYSMNFGSNTVPFSTDVKFLKDYLLLQKMRFNDRLSYTIDIDEELLGCELPKLLLQPVVENSLSHGTRHTRNITIAIEGRRVEDIILLTVKDNGDGIPPDSLDRLHVQMRESSADRHFGLYSVHRTVHLVYGEEYGLEITSKLGEGTFVAIRLPWEVEEAYV